MVVRHVVTNKSCSFLSEIAYSLLIIVIGKMKLVINFASSV